MTLRHKLLLLYTLVFSSSSLAQIPDSANVTPIIACPQIRYQVYFPSQSFNPLLTLAQNRIIPSRMVLLDARVGYWSNSFDAGLVKKIYNSEFIDNETLTRNYDRRERNDLVANGGATVGVVFGNDSSWVSHGLFIRQRYDLYLQMSKGLTGLLFFGNEPYENTTIDINGNGEFIGYRELQYAVSIDLSKSWTMLGTIGVLQGLQVNEGRYDGTLFTASEGDYLDIDHKFKFATYRRETEASFDSKGIAIGAAMFYRSPDTKHYLSFGLLETGWFDSDARNYSADTAVTFEGVNLDNLFTLNDSSFINFGDTLANYFGIEKTTKLSNASLPSTFYAHYTQRIATNWDVGASIEWQPILPSLVHASLFSGKWFTKSFYGAAQLNTLSLTGISLGIAAAYNLRLGQKSVLQTFVQAGSVSALLLPKSTKSFDLAATVALRF